jgi:hypothetical protein
MQNLFHDLRHAIRIIIRNSNVILLAAFTLALGIGAAVAIFSVTGGELLSKLSRKKPDRLMMVWNEFRSPEQEVPIKSGEDVRERLIYHSPSDTNKDKMI